MGAHIGHVGAFLVSPNRRATVNDNSSSADQRDDNAMKEAVQAALQTFSTAINAKLDNREISETDRRAALDNLLDEVFGKPTNPKSTTVEIAMTKWACLVMAIGLSYTANHLTMQHVIRTDTVMPSKLTTVRQTRSNMAKAEELLLDMHEGDLNKVLSALLQLSDQFIELSDMP